MPPDYSNVRVERIGRARDELREIAMDLCLLGHQYEAARILAVVEGLMYRMSHGKRPARAKQAPITSETVAAVLQHLRLNPDLHYRDVGRLFGIDGGRVCEIKGGIRTVDDPTGSRPELTG